MKSMSNSLLFCTNLLLLATPLLFNQTFASSYSGDCGTLHIIVAKPIYEKYQLSSDPVVNHGSYIGCKEVDSNTGECTDFEFSQAEDIYGPDTDIKFTERNGNKKANIKIQQNYCFSEAGKIKVETKNGIFKYKTYPGSWAEARPGVASIISIETPD